MPQNQSERFHFKMFFRDTRTRSVLINATLCISSSGKNQGKLREFHSGFPVGTLNHEVLHTEYCLSNGTFCNFNTVRNARGSNKRGKSGGLDKIR